MKICSKCKTEKPKLSFSRSSREPDGLQGCCKSCMAAYNRARYDAKPENIAARNRKAVKTAARTKVCTHCKREKMKSDFSKESRAKDGVRATCKTCMRARGQAYRESSQDKRAAYRREHYAANRASYAAYNRKYREENLEANAERNRLWRAENPEKLAARRRKHRALKRNAEGSHSAADVLAILAKQGGRCANCQSNLSRGGPDKFHVDHIQALSRGGRNDKYNLQCLCPRCNLHKSAKCPIAFAQEQGRLL